MTIRKLIAVAALAATALSPVAAFAQGAAPAVTTPAKPAVAAPATPAAPAVTTPAKPTVAAPAAATPAVATPAKPAAPAAATAPAAQTQGKKVNLNTATEAELDTLPQIGAARAKAIIAERTKKKFASFEDLVSRGVIPANAEAAIKDKVTFR